MYTYLFDQLPYPDIDLNLDTDITVRQILAYSGTQVTYDSKKPHHPLPFTPPNPYVHVHIKGGAILLDEKVRNSVISTSPLVTSTPDKVMSSRFTRFTGAREHPWESHERSRAFHKKYIGVDVDTGLVDFVCQRVIAEAGWHEEPAPKLARVWLTIAAAEVQRMYPTETWFAPHITDWFLESAARRAFSSGNWEDIVTHAYDEYLMKANGLWQDEDSFPTWDNADLCALSMPLV